MIRGRGIIYPKHNSYHMAARFRMRQLGETYIEAYWEVRAILLYLEKSTNPKKKR